MAIEAEGVVKRFGRERALDGAGLRVAAGEVVGLAGPNGAGKTTLIHLLLGLLVADAGRLAVLGRDPLERGHLGEVGWMPERPAFPPRRRVEALVRFQAATFPGWDRELAARWVERLEIPLRSRARDLSRGAAARLALLLALCHRPRVLLLDDPTLGLDPTGRRLVLGEVLAAAAESGAAVLVATHLLGEAESALDRVVLLQRGRVRLEGAVEELRSRHRRLRLPPDAEPPEELGVVETASGSLATRWSEAAWSRYRRRVPGAVAEPIGLEDLYVGLTGPAGRRSGGESDLERKGEAA